MGDMEDLKLETVGRQTLNQKVYKKLKLSILNGSLTPGKKLNEVQVAEQMDVSPTPVREAFRMLAMEGLVEIIPWKGVVVREFSSEEILEVYQCREALEILAIRLAIDKISNKDIEDLDKYIEYSEKAKDVSELVAINTKIHNFIIKHANNKKLEFLLSLLDDVLLHDRNISAFDDRRSKEIQLEHIEIINAFKNRDTKGAENAMKKHIRNGYNYIEKR